MKNYLSSDLISTEFYERAEVLSSILDYVLDGLIQPYGLLNAEADSQSLRTALNAHIGEVGRHRHTFSSVMLPVGTGVDAWDPVVAEFERSVEFSSPFRIATPNIASMPEKVRSRLVQYNVHNIIPLDGKANPTVEGAFWMACSNVTQTETQLIMLEVLGTLCTAELPVEAVRTALYSRLSDYYRSLGMFGLLLSGDEAHLARSWMAHTFLKSKGSIDMSVVGYLNARERLPGSYSATEDGAFRASINTYA